MGRKFREQYEKHILAQALCDAWTELLIDGKIKSDSLEKWFQKAGARLDLVDLLPRMRAEKYPDPEVLKAAIRARSPLASTYGRRSPLDKIRDHLKLKLQS